MIIVAGKIMNGKWDTACLGTDSILLSKIDKRWSKKTLFCKMRELGEKFQQYRGGATHVLLVNNLRDFKVLEFVNLMAK